MLAADPVHDLERALAGPAAGRAGHERDELLGLVGAGADVERLDRQARVADPGEAVVPVALAADRLGQRGRRRGHDRAGRPVAQALQHARAHADELAVRPVVDVVLRLPGAPASAVSAIRSATSSAGGRHAERAATRAAPTASRSRAAPLSDLEGPRMVESSSSSGTAERILTRPAPNVRAPPSSSLISGHDRARTAGAARARAAARPRRRRPRRSAAARAARRSRGRARAGPPRRPWRP